MFLFNGKKLTLDLILNKVKFFLNAQSVALVNFKITTLFYKFSAAKCWMIRLHAWRWTTAKPRYRSQKMTSNHLVKSFSRFFGPVRIFWSMLLHLCNWFRHKWCWLRLWAKADRSRTEIPGSQPVIRNQRTVKDFESKFLAHLNVMVV